MNVYIESKPFYTTNSIVFQKIILGVSKNLLFISWYLNIVGEHFGSRSSGFANPLFNEVAIENHNDLKIYLVTRIRINSKQQHV